MPHGTPQRRLTQLQAPISRCFPHCSTKQHLPEGYSLTCGVGPVRMGHGRAQGPRAELVVQEAAGWRGEAAGVEMVVRGVEGMDGMSTNHSCG